MKIPYDVTDFGFRFLFSLIFLALGFEHLFSDELLQTIMPEWLMAKRLFSVLAGVILLTGGTSVLLGYRLKAGAAMLAIFLVLVTLLVHAPAVFLKPDTLSEDCFWLWDVYQRSNLVKNLCLLGVCLHLMNHRLGRVRLDKRPRRRSGF